ncbi:MAG: hypothetical protein COA78_13550 [Blastopirellula sp.]|nr:MAG: hypothetical protein COA78_13550 [Blastopirellula sp.]
MMIKPIKDKQAHEAAKEQMQKLMLSPSSKDTSDEIEVLAVLIENYEKERIVVDAPTPIAAIRLRMEQKNMTPRELEKYIGSRARVSEVLSGKRKLTVDMMRALNAGLRIPYESLMKKEDPSSADKVEVSQPILTKLREIGLDLQPEGIGAFLKNAFGEQYVPSLNRKTQSQRASGKTDDNALLIWQGAVLDKAARNPPTGTFSPKQINKQFLIAIAQLSTHSNGPLRAIQELSKHGITVVVLPLLPGTFLDGAVMLLKGEVPVIGLTLRHDRIDNFWFTLLHELAHLARHYEILSTTNHVFFDELDIDSDDVVEKEADDLAKNCLLPSKFVKSIFKKVYSSNDDIEKVSKAAGVHVSIVAGRWQKENSNYKKFSRLIERNTVREMLSDF